MCAAEQIMGAYPVPPLILDMISSKFERHNPQQTTEAQGQRSGETFSDLRVVLSDIEKSLEGISSACTLYSECAEKIKEQPPPFPAFQQDVDAFGKDIEIQESHQREVINGIAASLEHDIRKQVELTLGDRLSDVIREETAKIVREEVDEHIKDYLPVSLKKQAEESTMQLQDIRVSLQNSLARTQNSYVERMRLDDQLLPLLTPIGEKSPHHPSSITRLFEYDLEKAKALSKDYGLADSDDIRTHFQQFLRHIGTSVDVVVSSDLETTVVIDPEDLDN